MTSFSYEVATKDVSDNCPKPVNLLIVNIVTQNCDVSSISR